MAFQPEAAQGDDFAAFDHSGGPYRESLDFICQEIHTAALPLLIHTPNMAQKLALDRTPFTIIPWLLERPTRRLVRENGL